jgi:hypothetical protein
MPILLPVLLPFVAALAILAMQRFRPGFGLSYFLAILVGMINWGIMLWFRWNPPEPYVIASWLPIPGAAGALIFQLDSISWPYAFSTTSLAAGVLLTASARLAIRSIPAAWAGTLLVSGASLLGIIASSPIGLALSWMFIDSIELILILGTVNLARLSQQAVLAFSARMLGIFFLLLAVAISQSRGQALILIDPPPDAGLFLLVAAGLRLGVLPLHLPYTAEVPLRRGLGTLLRLASPASSLVLLSRLPASVIPVDVSPFLLFFAALAALYGAAMWVSANNEINARPYWMIALAGMAVASVIRGYPLAGLAWGNAMILCGGTIFLFNARGKAPIQIPLLLSFVALTGLPFTPFASGWSGLVIPPINLPDIMFLSAHAMLLGGFFRRFFRPGDDLSAMERWIGVLYPAGLYLLVISSVVLGIFGWPGSLSAGVWWSSILSVALTVGIRFLRIRLAGRSAPQGDSPTWYVVLGQRAGKLVGPILRLDWLYQGMVILFRLVRRLIFGLTGILEGEGGVLWVLVLLALMISWFLSGAPQ